MIKRFSKDKFHIIKNANYINVSIVFITLTILYAVLYLGSDIFVPLTFAVILSMLLNPFVNYLISKKMPRALAILLALTLSFIVLAIVVLVISAQISGLSESYPELQKKLRELIDQGMKYLNSHYNISERKVNSWIDEKQEELMKKSGLVIGVTVTQVTSMLFNLILLPVYMFLLLWYKKLIVNFIHKLFNEDRHQKIGQILTESQSVIQGYLIGLLVELVIVAVLNIAGLLIIGVKYAVLFGLLGAILNLIPYIGIIIASLLPIIFALLLQSPQHALFVIILYSVVQFVDNNFIVPKVVASKVQINALASIIVVLFGGSLWGITGMFLSIPIAALAKVIFDKIDELKPWGYVLGEE